MINKDAASEFRKLFINTHTHTTNPAEKSGKKKKEEEKKKEKKETFPSPGQMRTVEVVVCGNGESGL